MKTVWKYNKKEDRFFTQESIPKKGFFILEEIEQISPGGISIHFLDAYIDKEVKRICDYTSYCGFDRGPKKQAKFKNMITFVLLDKARNKFLKEN